ncbi:aldolase catalytic domain-containing protein [Campylobacter lari]|uniref:aldolase catalytic domain-containing protein n=1 Tax=Campylobacter lari TaxID=201 RepID=UPI00127F6790|nr:aldolase catalytic domain-containing protein [Campylobacter lari]MBT0819576.1 aldolase catalytic domain-containing protein [Campylobacter lari]MBT0833790.1 aldolase catalytic domain-containing protein [Campylobacter lari]
MNINILDCTLRDGGYVNNWNFKDDHIEKILNALVKAKIDIIEFGYLNDNGLECNSTLFKNTYRINGFIKKLNISKDVYKVAMINYGDFSLRQLSKSNQCLLDGIRLAFHKEKFNEVIEYAKEIQNLGYDVFFQPMVTKKYSDKEFLEAIEKTNKLKPKVFYIVDSFGSMNLQEFKKYTLLANDNLDKDIALGYHSHNNMQLAFSNAVSLCEQMLKREIVIDSSIYGMGRGAGNLNTELIIDYLNKTSCDKYNIMPLLDIIDALLSGLMSKYSWGFSPAQYLSASLNIHPNYANYLTQKRTNNISMICEILKQIPQENSSSFNKDVIEKLYIKNMVKAKIEAKNFIPELKNKKILLIASGSSVKENEGLIKDAIKSERYLTIAINHKPKFDCDYYFFSNQKRYDEFRDAIESDSIILTNNINGESNVVLDYSKIVFLNDNFITNSTIIILNYLVFEQIKEVGVAGLDGYDANKNNYSYDEYDIEKNNEVLLQQNKIIANSLELLKNKIKINFITKSIFNKGIK